MSINGVKYKGVDPATPEPLPSTQEMMDMKKNVQDALALIQDAHNYDQYLNTSEQAELAFEEGILNSKLYQIEHYLKTGEWIDVSSTDPTADPSLMFADLADVNGGWYARSPLGETSQPNPDPNDGECPDYIDESDYGGTIEVENESITADGNIIPSTLWFFATSDEDPTKNVVDIKGKTVGDDVVVTVTYESGDEKSYVVKGAAINPNIQIGINGLKCTGPLNIDFSEATFYNPSTGAKSGVYIIGTKYDDKIVGSGGDDVINGAGGNDILEGFAGIDDVSGYANANVLAIYGAESLGEDGDDNIYDAFATDQTNRDFVTGGGGIDHLYRAAGEGATDGATQVEYTNEVLAPSDANEVASYFTGNPGTVKGDEYVITAEDDANIEMKVPTDGGMVSGARDGDDLILTIAKPGSGNEAPSYYKVRVKNYFICNNVNMKMTGEFIDLSNINIGANSVSLNGTGADGDILLGPKSIFDELGVDVNHLGVTSLTQQEAENKLEGMTAEPWSLDTTKAEGGVIVIDGSGLDELNIPSVAGKNAFVTKDAEGNVYVTVVANTSDTEADYVVIKITGNPDIKIKLSELTGGFVYDLRGSAIDSYGVTINGQGGTDFTAGYEYSADFQGASASSGHKINVAEIDKHEVMPITAEEILAGFEDQIDNLDSTEETVENYQAILDAIDNSSLTAEEKQEAKDYLYDAIIVKVEDELALQELEKADLDAGKKLDGDSLAKLVELAKLLAVITDEDRKDDIKELEDEIKAVKEPVAA